MQNSQWVAIIFKSTPIYTWIDAYLDWQDLVHLLCACKELYHNWISSDWKRWRHLKCLKQLCCAVGFQQTYLGSPLKQIRLWACDSSINPKVDTLYTNKRCMGGCGNVRRPCNVTHMKYAICIECAQTSSMVVSCMRTYKLTELPYAYAFGLVKEKLGEERAEKHELYINSRLNWYLSKMFPEEDWIQDGVFTMESVERVVDFILSSIKE